MDVTVFLAYATRVFPRKWRHRNVTGDREIS